MIAGSNTNTFQYDPMNYRIGRTGGTLGTRDYYLEGEHLEAEYTNNQLQAKYFRGISTDELIAGFTYINGTSTSSIYHHDSLTSVTGQTAHEGTSQQGLVYSAFGNLKSLTGSTQNRIRYAGREVDVDTDLYYNRARYYDPSVGRFISEDPLGFEAGVNFYTYVNNDPLNYNDPFGKFGYSACPGCLIPIEFFQKIGRQTQEFINGVVSYPVGVYNAVDYETRFYGLQGQEEQIRAQAENVILNQIVGYGLQNPGQVFDIATDYVLDNPARVAGRGLTGVGVSHFASPYIGFPLSGMAVYGDVRAAVESGVTTIEGVIRSGIGGQSALPTGIDTINFNLIDTPININSSAAGGGFVLYPNRPNTNMIQSVYSK